MFINLKEKILVFFRTDWFICFLILGIFLLSNGYQYAWDDQHLEIPLLKSLIDPSLYVGDYYVESLKVNYISFFYLGLAKLISLPQIPSVYFILYLVSRYFLFFWLFKIWKFISQKSHVAFGCVTMFILVGRVPEFLYRTFSHQEFALAIIFAGIYFLYKERFVIAAALLGIAVNIHALYSLFPMLYMLVYLCLNRRHGTFQALVKSCAAFFLCALPFFIWAGKKYLTATHAAPGIYENWYALYTTTCSQNFLFLDIPIESIRTDITIFFKATQKYWFILSLFILNFVYNEDFRKDKKCLAVLLTSSVLLGISFYFNYVQPNRFILDLNLVRNTQYMLIFLVGYTTILAFDKVRTGPLWFNVTLGFFFILLSVGDMIGTYAACGIFFSLMLAEHLERKDVQKNFVVISILVLLITGLLLGIYSTTVILKYRFVSLLKYFVCLGFLILTALILKISTKENSLRLRVAFIFIPILVMFGYYCQFHMKFLKKAKEGDGFWQLQRSWLDMQNYVKDHTPKDSLFLVPYDMEMGGFRILSNRKVLVCYRDCGIVGFDYSAALEWKKRIADIEAFKVLLNEPIKTSVLNALLKYKVDYIVFPTYYAPKETNPALTQEYENDVFMLFKVTKR